MTTIADLNSLLDSIEANAKQVVVADDESTEVSSADLDALKARLQDIENLLNPPAAATAQPPAPTPAPPATDASSTPTPGASQPATANQASWSQTSPQTPSESSSLPPLVPPGS